MKTFIALASFVAVILAEPPPSNSYLPPSPAGRSGGGYPQGGPQGHGGQFGAHGGHGGQFGGHGGAGQFGGLQVVAARSFDHGHGAAANGFARNAGSHHHGGGAQARFGGHNHEEEGYDSNAANLGRSGFDDAGGEPASYNFGYMVNDFEEGTDFGHHEERQDDRAEGEYHVVLPDGRKQTVSYEADERGFKPHISYEDSDALARANGGYDANANNIQGNDFQHGGHGSHSGHGSHGNARSGGY